MTDIVPLQYPDLFQGLFDRKRQSLAPLVEAARVEMHALALPAELRPFYDTVVRENPQPSFMLMPLVFLATSEVCGGIQAVHREVLPLFMLSMEAIATLDDTVDRTPMRSGRPTFVMRFGEASTTPFVGAVVALIARELARIEPRVLDVTMRLFLELCSLQLWERHHVYPEEAQFELWLENRYRQSTTGISFGLDTALLLGGRELAPTGMLETFGRILQDVDDIVNLHEDRDTDGENDDLLMGIVTQPLLRTLAHHPAMRAELAELWRLCRATSGASVTDLGQAPASTRAAIEALARPIRQAIRAVGIPETVTQVLADYRACVAAAPPEIGPVVRELARTWVDRLRRRKGAELVTNEQIERALADIAVDAPERPRAHDARRVGP